MSEQNADLDRLRHSASHVMAEAVLSLFPDAKIAIGPAIEDGFYYDFDLSRPLVPEDMERIETKMKELLAKKSAFVVKEVSLAAARKLFTDQPYKLEMIADLAEKQGDALKLSTYTQGGFTDLCKGPHLASTDAIPAEGVKLLSIAGAYLLRLGDVLGCLFILPMYPQVPPALLTIILKNSLISMCYWSTTLKTHSCSAFPEIP